MHADILLHTYWHRYCVGSCDRWEFPKGWKYACRQGCAKRLWSSLSARCELISGFWSVRKCHLQLSQGPVITLQWRYNERDGVLNHRHLYCLLKRLFKRRSKKTSKLRVTGLCGGRPVDSPLIGPVTRKMFPLNDVITIETCVPKKLFFVQQNDTSNNCTDYKIGRWDKNV